MATKVKIIVWCVVGVLVFAVALYFGIRIGLSLPSSLALGGSGAGLLGLVGLSAHAGTKSGSMGSVQDLGKEALRAGQDAVRSGQGAREAGRSLAESTQQNIDGLHEAATGIADSTGKLEQLDADRARLDEDLGRLFSGKDSSAGH